jgi:hypothetical protein
LLPTAMRAAAAASTALAFVRECDVQPAANSMTSAAPMQLGTKPRECVVPTVLTAIGYPERSVSGCHHLIVLSAEVRG